MERNGSKVILIAGPTASGKSAIALDLARRLGGTVINADSVQVYADLHILSSRPAASDLAQAPHRLFGHVDAAINYSVGHWLAEVRPALDEADAAGRPAILVGGTGLYFKALTQGLSAIPAVPEAVRTRLRTEAEHCSAAELHARLVRCDPLTAARLRPTDPQRILRALEVYAATGVPLASFQGARQAPLLAAGRWIGVFLTPERAELNRRIDERFDRMVRDGAAEEVARLGARQLDATLPAMRALGVPQFLANLAGIQPLEAAIQEAKLKTRQYAKRQVTFGRHQLGDFHSLAPEQAQEWAAGLRN